MDSGSLVVDTMAAGGKTRRCYLTFLVLHARYDRCLAALGGGLNSVQALALATAFPFTIIIILMSVSLILGLVESVNYFGATRRPLIHRNDGASR